MSDTRIVRFEVELELADDNTRLRTPRSRMSEIAAATAEAAEKAYEGSDATPALKEVRWRYRHLQAH
jgi:hypothetical protein